MPLHAFVQGAGRGLGRALAECLLARGHRVTATARRPPGDLPGARWLPLDLEDEASIAAAAAAVDAPIDRLFNVAGLLHDGDLQPEKRLDHCEPEHLLRSYRVNAVGPLLMVKHLHRHLAPDAVVANLSARVGSIGDNRLGGWYAYRAAKAAQNMFTRNLAIELARKHPGQKVVGLHPGTVATELSAPFRRHAPVVFPVDRAAQQLLDVVESLPDDASGRVFAWDGSRIEP